MKHGAAVVIKTCFNLDQLFSKTAKLFVNHTRKPFPKRVNWLKNLLEVSASVLAIQKQ